MFSHHTSNPLEASPSNPVNKSYKKLYGAATAGRDAPSSDDELGNWDDLERYQEHVKDVVQSTHKAMDPATPKAGPSRTGAYFRSAPPSKHVDLDEDMQSEDPLSFPYIEDERQTIDPRKEFKAEKSETTFATDDIEEEHTLMNEDEGEGHYFQKGECGEPLQYDDDDDFIVRNRDDPNPGNPDDIKPGNYEGSEDVFNYQDQDQEMDDGNLSDSRPSSLSSLTPLSSPNSSPFSSPQSSRPASPDESRTLDTKPQDEQDEILEEIERLYKNVPHLADNYELVDRLGTGTFSSVYKAIDLKYDQWDNKPWMGDHPPESSAHYQSAGPGFRGRGGRAARRRLANGDVDVDMGEDVDTPDQLRDGKVYVAIKRIYTTSGPERIRNELNIMEACRGCRHASQIMTAFRHLDQVVIVLPYQRNMDFREFYLSLHPEGIKCYFRCLFRALRDIHQRGIIHRDVKPANFLYDPFTGIGTLCDFGLASHMEATQKQGACLHTTASLKDPHGRTHTLDAWQTVDVKDAQKAARTKSGMPADKVGYPANDKRPVSKANRAGTRGFRAPEVLLKCGAQTGAIDVWSAGIIMLFFLTGKFPIFQSNDDIEALMEIAAIIGKKNTERVATLHARTIITNVPDLDHDGLTWQQFVEKLDPTIHKPRKYDMRFYPHNCKHRDGPGSSMQDTQSEEEPQPPSTSTSSHADRYANPPTLERHTKDMRAVFHLLEALLQVESTKRATPRQALAHTFLAEPGVDDDDFVPQRLGEGVCADWHGVDEVTGQQYVRVRRRCLCRGTGGEGGEERHEVNEEGGSGEDGWCGKHVEVFREIQVGEGIAIGKRPCEFHENIMF